MPTETYTAVRYHINPETGNPGKCSALKLCPFGSPEEHHSTPGAARASFEKLMSDTQRWSGQKRLPLEATSCASCRSCGAALSFDLYAHALHARKHPCPGCGKNITVSGSKVPVLSTSAHLLTLSGAKETTFFHATQRRNWRQVLSNPEARFHMGEHAAAADRALSSGHHLSDSAVWGFYELRLRPEATLGRKLQDTGRDLGLRLKGKPLPGDYNPYVNTYEAPGTVSAFVPAPAVELVSVRPVRMRELRETESLYTIFEAKH
jgi:predicted RNA-binding Zn-ribbon protein involved in translation (DUF1610 family)